MNIRELIAKLSKYPPDMKVKMLISQKKCTPPFKDFADENMTVYADTAHVDITADEEEWDCEDGKFELGHGEQYLLINPPVY